jgi:hypothetical protein
MGQREYIILKIVNFNVFEKYMGPFISNKKSYLLVKTLSVHSY